MSPICATGASALNDGASQPPRRRSPAPRGRVVGRTRTVHHAPMLRLARAAGIRAGEARILALVALLFTALEAGRGFGEVGVDTLVVSRLGTATLPYLFIGLGAASLVAALAYGAALGRLPRTALLVGVLLAASTLLVLGRLIIGSGTRFGRAGNLARDLRRGHHRGDDRMDGRRFGVRRPPGQTALPAMHRRGHRRQLPGNAGVGSRRPRGGNGAPGRHRGDPARSGSDPGHIDRAHRTGSHAGATARSIGRRGPAAGVR